MVHLAVHLLDGQGVKCNRARALEWMRLAAEKGHAEAALQLAKFHEHGGPEHREGTSVGVLPEKSDEDAYFWMKKSADMGHRPAYEFMSNYLWKGLGCEKHDEKAAVYMMACEKGDRIEEMMRSLQTSGALAASDAGDAAAQEVVSHAILKVDQEGQNKPLELLDDFGKEVMSIAEGIDFSQSAILRQWGDIVPDGDGFIMPRTQLKGVKQHCAHCFKLGDWQKCSTCDQVYYCSQDCQKSGWKDHKKLCSTLCKMKCMGKGSEAEENKTFHDNDMWKRHKRFSSIAKRISSKASASTAHSDCCANCGVMAKVSQLCPCHTAVYCGMACQTAHWPMHKKFCKKARKAMAEAQ